MKFEDMPTDMDTFATMLGNIIQDLDWDRILEDALYWIDLVGCFWFNGPLRQYFSLYRAVSKEGDRGEIG